MAELCPDEVCRSPIPPHVDRCPNCGYDVGFPNVRAANRSDEQDALRQRYQAALDDAHAHDRVEVVRDFERHAAKARAVMCRMPDDVHTLLSSLLITTYQQQTSGGLRTPDDDKWAWLRPYGEERWFTGYAGKIHYGVLSLDDRGAVRWGPIVLIFREPMIAKRTTVGEGNAVLIAKGLAPDEPLPPGHRALWNERATLCVAKLSSKLLKETEPAAYAGILLANDDGKGAADFVEVHIYGTLTVDSIACIYIPKQYEQEFARVCADLRRKNVEVRIVDEEPQS